MALTRGLNTVFFVCWSIACGSSRPHFEWPTSSSRDKDTNAGVDEGPRDAGTDGFDGPWDDEPDAVGPDGGRLRYGMPCSGFTVCGPDFVTRIRFAGALAALRSSSLTVCKNRRCYSANLGTFIDSFFQPHPGNKLVLGFPVHEEGSAPQPRITFSIASDAVTPDGCKPWCDAELGFTRAPGDADHDGDRYEVAIGTAGTHQSVIRDTARYQVGRIEDPCDPTTCYGFGTDRSKERPMQVH